MAKKAKATKVPVQPPRKLKAPSYRSFRLSKRIKAPQLAPLPSTWRLLQETKRQLWTHKKLFGGILLVYGALTLLFLWAGGSLVNVAELKSELNETLGTSGNSLVTNMALFSLLLGSAVGTTGDISNAYQSLIVIITILALIWAFRHTSDEAKKRLTIRDAFYRGSAPLITFVLVAFVVGLQMIPMLIASFLYSTVTSTGLAVTPIEQALWLLLFIVSVVLTLYMVSSSVFALYIVTLPNMTPMKALRSARKVVLHRRLLIMRKVFVAALILFALFTIIVVLSIYFIPQIAELIFFAGSVLIIPLSIGFIYRLYRSLL